MLICSSCVIADLISAAIMQSVLSVDDYGIFGYVHFLYFLIFFCLVIMSVQPICYEQ